MDFYSVQMDEFLCSTNKCNAILYINILIIYKKHCLNSGTIFIITLNIFVTK